MNLRKLSLIAIAISTLSACEKAAEDFVRGAVPGGTGVITQPSEVAQNDGTMFLKVSPARIQSTAVNGAIVGNISLTNRTYLAGPDMAVNLTINRNRTNPP